MHSPTSSCFGMTTTETSLPRNDYGWDGLQVPMPSESRRRSKRGGFGTPADTNIATDLKLETSESSPGSFGLNKRMAQSSSGRSHTISPLVLHAGEAKNQQRLTGSITSGPSSDSGCHSSGHRQAQGTCHREVIDLVSEGEDQEELNQTAVTAATPPISSVVDSSQRLAQLQDGALRPFPTTDDAILLERVYVGVRGYIGTEVEPLYVRVANEFLVLQLNGDSGAEVETEETAGWEEIPYKSIKKI
jgi:hypothetical protein